MKIAVVLFNLGGPDALESVRPFLLNLFSDPAILRVPRIIRYFLARLIVAKRGDEAIKNYNKMGGKSPLLEETRKQERALEQALKTSGEFRVFTAMRYWYPRSHEVVEAVSEWGADQVILLPLYPQFSTVTTASSVDDWKKSAALSGLDVPTRTLCCYPVESSFVDAHARLLRHEIEKAKAYGNPRILFSAHGIPELCVKAGDPYQWQIERCVDHVTKKLGIEKEAFVVCYQSKVGRLKWLEPSTEEEIRRAAEDVVPLVIVPIAFISEHIETLVELDMDYKMLAESLGVPYYGRVPALGIEAAFIESLKQLVLHAAGQDSSVCSAEGPRLCPTQFTGCPNHVFS